MINNILKFSLEEVPYGTHFEIDLPYGSVVRCVALQHELPHIWVELNQLHKLVTHTFRIFGTGESIDSDMYEYVGTWQDVPYVWHLYKRR